jgi:3-hydroxy-3-methylglutaryl CoA synthase
LINAAKADEELLLFSYGSGAVGELYSGEIQTGFDQVIDQTGILKMLADRQKNEYRRL